MADALVSPAVGGTTWLVAAGAIAHGARRLGRDADERIVPLMGALGAFVFTVQMINFSIPEPVPVGTWWVGFSLRYSWGLTPRF
ncbi:energy-coupling factor ABC transporter permease [Geotalea toluenoxydans]|uniref:energy-coupling factor ABC transporter permease n=1 Tax=Geotalea toluenoxydans TaxID=421624 RepID=UPI0024364DE7|nr:energy-coupling factor ABC transporter permease [Geotalea toluenoxydans]